ARIGALAQRRRRAEAPGSGRARQRARALLPRRRLLRSRRQGRRRAALEEVARATAARRADPEGAEGEDQGGGGALTSRSTGIGARFVATTRATDDRPAPESRPLGLPAHIYALSRRSCDFPNTVQTLGPHASRCNIDSDDCRQRPTT